MTTSKFSTRYNAQRSARRSLGATAREAVDFKVIEADGGFSWEAIDREAAEAALRAAVAERTAAEVVVETPEPVAEPIVEVVVEPEIEPAPAAPELETRKAAVAARLRGGIEKQAVKLEAKLSLRENGVRPGTKRATILELARRDHGVSLAEMTEVFPKCNHLTAIPANLAKASGGASVAFLREDGTKAWRVLPSAEAAQQFAAIVPAAPARRNARVGA
jgi:hypothetical protein